MPADSGLHGLAAIAGFFGIAADPQVLARDLALSGRPATPADLVRAAKRLGLKARMGTHAGGANLLQTPQPALVVRKTGGWLILDAGSSGERLRIIDPVSREIKEDAAEAIADEITSDVLLLQKRLPLLGLDPEELNLRWFATSLWRYRGPLRHVLIASFFVQIFALVSPLFFQVVVDKVLVHNTISTLNVIMVGLVMVIVFDTILQYLRTYILNHTTSRIDVELGHRLFSHLASLPISYFETRPTGQTIARMRELEKIRNFLTGQGLTAALDLFFGMVFVAVLFSYSTQLALVVVCTLPIYFIIVFALRPVLETRIEDMFRTGAASQQFLVESVVGMQTLKAAAIEPQMRREWDERLAAYVKTSFDASRIGALAQAAVQCTNRLVTAAILYFGAMAVMRSELSVGGLVAFNMIASQLSQPVLRLSQLWQDFQQVKVSMARIGDILKSAPEPTQRSAGSLPPIQGAIEFRNVSFRYGRRSPDVLKDINFSIPAGKRVGIVGPSGSGKSSLAKLVQRFYVPQEGRVLVDGIDLSGIDPAWLRSQIGVVLQENILFNRTVHENIALANPSAPRALVISAARLAGAHEFISTLPDGYDTLIEERGANLSGGQRQRIAIARALVTNPRILVFDEATSALDYESEAAIQRNMQAISQNRTVLIIAHRLSTVRDCDAIICMHDGRIIEGGTHEELLQLSDGLYTRLWSMQTGHLT